MTAQFAKDKVSFIAPTTVSTAPVVSVPRYEGSPAFGLRALSRWFTDRLNRRAVIEELTALSDHELADIGITRGDIPRVFDPHFVAARSLHNAVYA
jgi:uncharacterized protein YjiS (DUF1127 family)